MKITVSEIAKELVRQKGGAFYIDDGKTSVAC